MRPAGVYEVIGGREYRGHAHGEMFIARLDRAAEIRAMNRGDIRLLDEIVPAVEAGAFALPKGWLDE